jgi:hypothetical protein
MKTIDILDANIKNSNEIYFIWHEREGEKFRTHLLDFVKENIRLGSSRSHFCVSNGIPQSVLDPSTC